MKNHVPRSPAATTKHDGQLHDGGKPSHVREASLPTSPNRPTRSATTTVGSSSGPRGDVAQPKTRTVVAQFSVVAASDETRLRLFALKNMMHRILNAATSAWHLVDTDRQSAEHDSGDEDLGRSSVTAAVKALLEREREYWAAQAAKLAASEAKLRINLGRVRARGNEVDVAEAEKEHTAIVLQLERAECKASLIVPSAISDAVVLATMKSYAVYKKKAFFGTRVIPCAREGQPIRWRDGSWELRRTEKNGVYDLIVPVHSENGRLVQATLRVIPDGPGMYVWGKRMTDDDEVARGGEARKAVNELKKKYKPDFDRLKKDFKSARQG